MSARNRNAQLILVLSLVLAWLFDFLFWRKAPGISFPIFVAMMLGLGFRLAGRAGVKPHPRSLWLLLPIAFFLITSIWRQEPLSRILSAAAVFGLMALLAASFLSGRWAQYSLIDFVARFAALIPYGLVSYGEQRRVAQNRDAGSGLRALGPVARGLLLALPILWLLSALLSSADEFFALWLEDVLRFLRIENLPEHLFRAFYILVLGYALVAVYHYAFHRSRDEKLSSESRPLLKPFIGFGETATVLVSVELLFIAFVIIQFRYFFGGGANIAESAFTYAEYARRGFFELGVVAVLSTGLFVALSSAARREEQWQRRWFSRLGILLFALVAVILTSSYQRLLLYESAYGFTRLRTYAHVFMIWLGLLLVALVVLESLSRQRAFALAALVGALGFTSILTLINVDGFIVNANIERLKLGHSLEEPTGERILNSDTLDVNYLAWLSEDALPALLDSFAWAESENEAVIQNALLQVIGCHAALHGEYAAPEHWQSIHLSQLAASQLWADFRQTESYQRLNLIPTSDTLEYSIQVDGQTFECKPQVLFD